MTEQQEKMVELSNLLSDADNQSKTIELISEKLTDVHSTVGLDGRNIPSDKQRRATLGKDVLNCMCALQGANKGLETVLEKMIEIVGEVELSLRKGGQYES